jgi:hypothetical protein
MKKEATKLSSKALCLLLGNTLSSSSPTPHKNTFILLTFSLFQSRSELPGTN